jgi:hypothetical protein
VDNPHAAARRDGSRERLERSERANGHGISRALRRSTYTAKAGTHDASAGARFARSEGEVNGDVDVRERADPRTCWWVQSTGLQTGESVPWRPGYLTVSGIRAIVVESMMKMRMGFVVVAAAAMLVPAAALSGSFFRTPSGNIRCEAWRFHGRYGVSCVVLSERIPKRYKHGRDYHLWTLDVGPVGVIDK